MKIASNLDLLLNQALNVIIQNVATEPTTGNKPGRIIFDTSVNAFKYWDGEKWVTPAERCSFDDIEGILPVTKGGTGTTTLTKDEVLVGNGTDAVTTIAIDTEVTADSTNLITSGAVEKHVKEQLEAAISAVDSMKFMGTVDSTGVITSSDETINNKNITALTEYRKGWTFKASNSINVSTISDDKLEAGDIIIFLDDDTSYNKENITVVQNNIDGAVIGPDGSIDNSICIFDGTTGRLIKASSLTIDKLEDLYSSEVFNIDNTDADIVIESNNESNDKVAVGNTITAKLTETGVTAGTYSDNSSVSDDTGIINGTTVVVPKITVDDKGRITEIEDKEMTVNVTGFAKRFNSLNGTLTPTGGTCSWSVKHDLNCDYPVVNLYDYTTKEVILADIKINDNNTLTININSDAEIAASTYMVSVVG